MRLAVISDLHANRVALDAVLADADARGVQRVVCLGDIVDLGPEPVEVLEVLRARGIPCVQGNHDPLDEHPDNPMLAAIEAWTAARLAPEEHAFLNGLPASLWVDLDGVRVWCVHGSPRDDTDQVLDDTPREVLEGWCGAVAFDVLVCGHTHVQLLRRLDRRLIVNVGSVGMPFAEPFTDAPPVVLPWAEYAILEHAGGRLSVDLRRVPFDADAYARSVRRAGFPDAEAWLATLPR